MNASTEFPTLATEINATKKNRDGEIRKRFLTSNRNHTVAVIPYHTRS